MEQGHQESLSITLPTGHTTGVNFTEVEEIPCPRHLLKEIRKTFRFLKASSMAHAVSLLSIFLASPLTLYSLDDSALSEELPKHYRTSKARFDDLMDVDSEDF